MSSLNSVVSAQDLSNTVLPIADVKLKLKKKPIPSSLGSTALVPEIAPAIEQDFGTGFCIDHECRLIGTNYHVVANARPLVIMGKRVIHRYLATGPEDDGATLNDYTSEQPLRYKLSRDLAIFELSHPLSHYHGIEFSLDELELGQQVDIYAYLAGSINPIRRLARFHGSFKGTTTQGLLAFEYSSANGKPIHGGSSGGLVVDSKTHQVVGILSRAGLGKNGKDVALAVPVPSLSDFVSKVQPWLVGRIFSNAKEQFISPELADLYPKFQWPRTTGSLQHRPDEPPEVKALRSRAQTLADSMRNFVAVQTFSWGRGDQPPAAMAEYEVQVLEGFQRFREYPGGKEEMRDVPFPPINIVVNPGGEWSELPQMVGSETHLKIHQAADKAVNGRHVSVFQYVADVEDGVCVFKSVRDYGFFEASKIVTIPCHGEVWTDENMNILRISQHLELPGKWQDYQSVVNYGWIRLADNTPRLVPMTISTQAEFKNKIYWCRGLFTNYRIFDSQAKIVTGYYVQSLPQ
ncbi:MAG TPA: serine protease [Candidatus Acidoferrum sp.]|nr:serine protease [Candidatus Acidoferrum sp.]